MRQREVRRVWPSRPSSENDFSELLELCRATDARQQDAVLAERFRRSKLERDRAAPRVSETRLKIREAEPAEFILAAQRHVSRNESTLHRIYGAPYPLDVGPDVPRDEEA